MPMRRDLYPANWPVISRHIRFGRARGRCEQCGVQHGARGARDRYGVWHDEAEIEAMNSSVGEDLWPGGFPRIITIVLTCAHLDHNPANNAESNLAAYCQRCHLAHDQPLHAAHARRTRRSRRNAGMGLLPFDEDLAGHLVGAGKGGTGR